MKTVFIASDGKQFEDKWECEDYEWLLKHPEIKEIKIYDYLTNPVGNIFDFEGYKIATYLYVPTEAIDVLEEFAEYSGFTSYDGIDSEGWWKFDNKTSRFIKY